MPRSRIEREDLGSASPAPYATQAVQQIAMPAYALPLPRYPPPRRPARRGGAAAAAATSNDDLASNPGTLTSPMVGTAYLSPEPGKAGFAPVGKVSEGQTVMIIEAMKTMNQIPAHRSGTGASSSTTAPRSNTASRSS